MKRTFFLIAIATAATAVSTACGAVIDDFEEGPFTFIVTGWEFESSITQTGLNPSSVIGTERTVTLYNPGPQAESQLVWATLTTTGGDDSVLVDVDSDTYGVAEFRYGLSSDLNADLTVGGHNAVAVQVTQVSGNVRLGVTLGNGPADYEVAFLPVSSPGTYLFAYSWFPSIDVTDVDLIGWEVDELDGSAAAFSVADVRTIPEPSTVALLSMGTVALLAYAWRRRRAA